MSDCTCPPDTSQVCDDCAGMVEHLDHRTVRVCAFELCSKPLVQREREKPSSFRGRRFCSISCASRATSGSTAVHDSPDRECVCGTVMSRRSNESPARFAHRQFCSPACARTHQTRTPVQPVERETKTCVVCAEVMQRRKTETRGRFRLRDCCSTRCGAARRRAKESADAPVRVCGYAVCGKGLVRRVGEAPSQFAARRFCDRSCGTKHRNTTVRNTAVRDTGGESKPCEGCDVVIERQGLPPYLWRAKRFCSPGCASRSRARVEPQAAPSKDHDLLPVVERPAGPVWRPAGFSKVVNPWVGHRPQVSLRKAAS